MTVTYIVLAVVALIVGLLYFNMRRIRKMPETPQSQKIVTLTKANFNSVTKSGLVLVDFWAAWCMPCKMLSPILNEVAEATDGQARIAKLNVDEQQQLAAQFKVRGIPTMILFKNGREIDRIVGVKTRDFLVRKIEMAKFS